MPAVAPMLSENGPIDPSGIEDLASRKNSLMSVASEESVWDADCPQALGHRNSGPVYRSSYSTSRPSSSIRNMSTIRAMNESRLVFFAERNSSDVNQQRESPTCHRCMRKLAQVVFGLFGLTPFNDGLFCASYCNFVTLVAACSLVYPAVQSAMETSHEDISTMCFACGGLLGLISLRRNQMSHLIGPHDRLLEKCADARLFLDEWTVVSALMLAACCALWVCTVVFRAVPFLATVKDDEGCPGLIEEKASLMSLLNFAHVSGLFIALSYCQLHVMAGLELMVDAFCVDYFVETDFSQCVREWNVLQALLRRCASTMETSFVAVQTSVFAWLLHVAIQLVANGNNFVHTWTSCESWWGVLVAAPVQYVLLGVLTLVTLFKAALVSEKCARVPALVNSFIKHEKYIDHDRQFVVQYIANSAAGIYVKGVRLTAFMALKVTYILGALGVALFTHVASSSK
eukprot:gnl/TRDRNA2_/TRDRNA2_129942_c2_seq1.p1 gnl/TRDRNA2_/TRDRNA2_129942_c2~~gnl/TRDRNA2_/TRDRNA2_129942_c2_seq1.p1  ORF type:complete len:513 (-),score=74.71 gnl/TRDRNA2_/TRDRNA2_129942_c2_seq1:84-1457(-)